MHISSVWRLVFRGVLNVQLFFGGLHLGLCLKEVLCVGKGGSGCKLLFPMNAPKLSFNTFELFPLCKTC